jgi:hypothetical protein
MVTIIPGLWLTTAIERHTMNDSDIRHFCFVFLSWLSIQVDILDPAFPDPDEMK